MPGIQNAASLGASHMSLYALTVERGTPLYRDVHRETVKMPTQDEAAEMFERTVSVRLLSRRRITFVF